MGLVPNAVLCLISFGNLPDILHNCCIILHFHQECAWAQISLNTLQHFPLGFFCVLFIYFALFNDKYSTKFDMTYSFVLIGMTLMIGEVERIFIYS